LNVSAAIDKHLGAERDVLSETVKVSTFDSAQQGGGGWTRGTVQETAPVTDEAKKWQGWHTSLKPAFEPVVVARKPLVGTVAANVLEYGTGAMNIDGCRVATTDNLNGGAYAKMGNRKESASLHGGSGMNVPGKTTGKEFEQPAGRWPTNALFDEHMAAELDAQTGHLKAGGDVRDAGPRNNHVFGRDDTDRGSWNSYGDSGGASRFFPVFRYESKAPRSERPSVDGVQHATVKPLELMRWLVRLVCPKVSVVVCCECGKDMRGVRRNVSAEILRAARLRHSVQTKKGGESTQASSEALSHVREDSHRQNEEILRYKVSGTSATEATSMPYLSRDVPRSQENVLQAMRQSSDDVGAQEMRGVQEGFSAPLVAEPVLQQKVRGSDDRLGEAARPDGDISGICDDLRTRASDGDQARLFVSTPEGGGRDSGSDAGALRGSASSQRNQVGQQARESESPYQSGSRQNSEAPSQANRVPSLRGKDQGLRTCASCGGALVHIEVEGIVLDPFAGSGTTGEAAIHEHKKAILIELEASHLPLIVSRLSKPMELGFDFEEL
jgi:hypothetical protein